MCVHACICVCMWEYVQGAECVCVGEGNVSMCFRAYVCACFYVRERVYAQVFMGSSPCALVRADGRMREPVSI